MCIFEASDDETATAMLQIATDGDVTTSTNRIFTAAEMNTILDRLNK